LSEGLGIAATRHDWSRVLGAWIRLAFEVAQGGSKATDAGRKGYARLRGAGPDVGGNFNLVGFIKTASGYGAQVRPAIEGKANRCSTDGAKQHMNALTALVGCVIVRFNLAVVEFDSVKRED